MNSIFNLESDGKLFLPLKRLLLPNGLEDVLESGFITIVPDAPGDVFTDGKLTRSAKVE